MLKFTKDGPGPHFIGENFSLVDDDNTITIQGMVLFPSSEPSIAERAKEPFPHVNAKDAMQASWNAAHIVISNLREALTLGNNYMPVHVSSSLQSGGIIKPDREYKFKGEVKKSSLRGKKGECEFIIFSEAGEKLHSQTTQFRFIDPSKLN